MALNIPPDLNHRVMALERMLPDVPPIFRQLFAYLPLPGADFPSRDRLAFLRAAAALADVAYGPAAITIELSATGETKPSEDRK